MRHLTRLKVRGQIKETKKEEPKVDESKIKQIGEVKYRPFTEEERIKEAEENDALAKDLDNLQADEWSKIQD